MKNIYILVILITLNIHSQNVYFSTGIDVKNALIGSKPTNNNSALDVTIQFGMIEGNTEVVIGYEKFETIYFDKFWFGVGHHFNVNENIKIIPSLEPSLIGRWGDTWQTTSSHLSIGGSLALRYKINYHLSIELQCNALPRTDLSARYPTINPNPPIIFSNYLKILYRL